MILSIYFYWLTEIFQVQLLPTAQRAQTENTRVLHLGQQWFLVLHALLENMDQGRQVLLFFIFSSICSSKMSFFLLTTFEHRN